MSLILTQAGISRNFAGDSCHRQQVIRQSGLLQIERQFEAYAGMRESENELNF